jgi:hypothetical protein
MNMNMNMNMSMSMNMSAQNTRCDGLPPSCARKNASSIEEKCNDSTKAKNAENLNAITLSKTL